MESAHTHVDCSLILTSLGPYKLAFVLNKCLDRFEHPDENVQPNSNLTHISTPNLPQSKLPERSKVISPSLVDMPPLLHQPNWAETDLPQSSQPSPDSSNISTPTVESLTFGSRELPIRPRLTIPSKSYSSSPNILITDDNAINRKVSTRQLKSHILDVLLMRCSFLLHSRRNITFSTRKLRTVLRHCTRINPRKCTSTSF